MKRALFIMAALLILIMVYGCEKEKIVTNTEIVKETEYIETDPDTVMITDTVIINNSSSDTIFVTDTVSQTEYIYDTITETETVYIHDTVTVTQTEYIYDTVTVTNTVYDTVIQQSADANLAYTSMQSYVSPMVFDLIYSEFQLTDGFVLYLAIGQNDMQNPSTGVYDMFGYAEYWTADASGYYPLEYYFRMTYNGGDPANPANWSITDPPSAINGITGGIHLKDKVEATHR